LVIPKGEIMSANNASTIPAAQNCSELLTFSNTVPEQVPPDAPDLPPRQLAALELMLQGHSDTAISATLKIARRTLYTWKHHDPTFRAILETSQRDLFSQSTNRLRTLLTSALDALEKQVKDPYTPTSHRAARTLLNVSRLGSHLAPKPFSNLKSQIPDPPMPDSA
jgi:hypothetical protein